MANDTVQLRLVGYLRVSSTGQATDGFGLPVQKRELQKWAISNGHEIVAWCQDAGVSGMVEALDRPGFRCVIDHIHTDDIDGAVMFDLSRLARSLHIQEAALAVLWNAGAKVFTATLGEVPADDPEDPTRTMIRQILGAVAQFQRAEQVRKMRMGKELKASRGGRSSGAAPFGWRSERGELVPDTEEQNALDRIRELRQEQVTFREIADRLNAEGVFTKNGRQWSKQALSIVLSEADRRVAAGVGNHVSRKTEIARSRAALARRK